MPKKNRFFLIENWRITILVFSGILGIVLSVIGFSKIPNVDSFYETARLFLMSVQFDKEWMPLHWTLIVGRWLIFITLILFSFRLFFEIVAPQFLRNLSIIFYRKHIVICGLNKITINLIENLIEKYGKKQIVVLAEETNRYAEALKANNAKLLVGDFSDDNFLKKSRLKKANVLYAFVDNDKVNVKIAQSVSLFLENEKVKNNPLKCFVLIKDRELKLILEETPLFKYKTDFFDGNIFNINEMGMKYGIVSHIDKILPKEIKTPPEILLIGLTEKTEFALVNLVHCLTMQRESFRFTIVEKNPRKIRYFQKEYSYFQNFAEITFVSDIDSEKYYDTVLVCTDNPIEAVKQSVDIRYLFGEKGKNTNILVFCNETDTFNEVLKKELVEKNIFPVILFSQIADYVFELDENIEEKAKETHYFWNMLYNQNKEWDEMAGHFKQSSRNQILDNYLRIYIARGETFNQFNNRLVSFSDLEKETLAMMEHRRWVIEKLVNGWVAGDRNNDMKRHNCLVLWEQLSDEEKSKDFDAIDLMFRLLNNQNKYK